MRETNIFDKIYIYILCNVWEILELNFFNINSRDNVVIPIYSHSIVCNSKTIHTRRIFF